MYIQDQAELRGNEFVQQKRKIERGGGGGGKLWNSMYMHASKICTISPH